MNAEETLDGKDSITSSANRVESHDSLTNKYKISTSRVSVTTIKTAKQISKNDVDNLVDKESIASSDSHVGSHERVSNR